MTGRSADKNIAGGTVGAISELEVAADLMKKGYSVFRALSPACYCDLIAVKNGAVDLMQQISRYIQDAQNEKWKQSPKN